MKKLGGCLKIIGGVVVVLLVLGLVVGGSNSGGKNDSSSGAQSQEKQAETQVDSQGEAGEEPEEAPEPEPVTYQDVDINTLFDTLSNNPLNAKNTFECTRVRFSGSLKNIDASGKYFSLGNGDEWSFDSIQCFIQNDDTLNRIASASMGDTITVCGTVTSVGEILGYSVDVDYIE
ncbi:MAG: hypothetical protein IJ781_13650 [Atopobiaceae bacterium]|nr:hypothetical protein [Atopobiaceae bacterium]